MRLRKKNSDKTDKTDKTEEVEIARIHPDDFSIIESSEQFAFNWRIEQKNDIYKIYLIDTKEEILGLLSLVDVKTEYRIYIELIEVSAKNIGKEKEYEHIAGCLIAFACQMAFEKSYDGFVSLIPKTKLINHYHTQYGFKHYGSQMAVEGFASTELIKKYLS